MTTEPDDTGSAVPHLVMRAARRRWRLVLAGAIVGGILGAALATVLPHKFVSAAQVLVRPVPSDTTAARPTAAVTMETEAQIARSSVVRERAAERLAEAGDVPDGFGSGLAVSVVPETQVLRLAYTASTPKAAKAAAQAYAEAYLQNRQESAQDFVAEQRRQLTNQLASIEAERTDIEAERAEVDPSSATYRSLTGRLSNLDASAREANAELSALPAATGRVNPGQVIQEAASADRSGLTPMTVAVAGLLLGVVLGLAVATLRERTDPRLLEPGDLPDDLGVPLLSVLPPQHPGGGVLDPDGPGADAYRQLRNEIFLGPQPPVVLAVSRVDAETGTGDVTANLAVLLARSGRRVCVIDTDTSAVRLDTLLEGHERVGLVHAAPGGDGRFEPGIAVVTQREGMGQAELGDLLASPLFSRLIDATRHEAEVVLIDAPPALTSAGQAVLATADAVLLVVTRRRTRRADVQNAQDRIRRVGSRLVGTALRDTDFRAEDTGPPAERRDASSTRPALPPGERTGLPGPGHVHPIPAEAAHQAAQQTAAPSPETPVFAPTPPGGGPWVTETGTDPLVVDGSATELFYPGRSEPAAAPAPAAPAPAAPAPAAPTAPAAPPAATPAATPATGPTGDLLEVPLGWPETVDGDGEQPPAGSPVGLGWPDSWRALT